MNGQNAVYLLKKSFGPAKQFNVIVEFLISIMKTDILDSKMTPDNDLQLYRIIFKIRGTVSKTLSISTKHMKYKYPQFPVRACPQAGRT